MMGGRVRHETMERRRIEAEIPKDQIVSIDMAKENLKVAKSEWEIFKDDAQKAY